MNNHLPFAALLALILMPCLLGWIAGQVHGARRMRKLVEGRDPQASPGSPFAYISQSRPAGFGAGYDAGHALKRPESGEPANRRPLSIHDLKEEGDRIRARRRGAHRFGDEHAVSRRSSPATKLTGREVLDHYLRSIDALRLVGARALNEEMIRIEPEDPLPRISDIAPIPLPLAERAKVEP